MTRSIPEDILTKEVRQRFWSKVKKGPDCWEWQAGREWDGYGIFSISHVSYRAHRLSWIMTNGGTGGLLVLHKCDNPSCVRPDHLWLGTVADNNADRDAKGRTARGDRHGSKTKPECVPRGDRHGSKTHPECVPRGERHGSKTKPHRVASGDRNGSRTMPWRLKRGDDHHFRKNPELIARGERSGQSKVTEADVRRIREMRKSGMTLRSIGQVFDIGTSAVHSIVNRATWKHVK